MLEYGEVYYSENAAILSDMRLSPEAWALAEYTALERGDEKLKEMEIER